MEKSIFNSYGEKINIKIENNEIFVHHEDISECYITIDKLFIEKIINIEELTLIYNTVKEISLQEFLKV